MNPILRQSFIASYALKLARAALESREQVAAIRAHIRARYGAEVLEAIDSEWAFTLLALMEARNRKSRRVKSVKHSFEVE